MIKIYSEQLEVIHYFVIVVYHGSVNGLKVALSKLVLLDVNYQLI